MLYVFVSSSLLSGYGFLYVRVISSLVPLVCVCLCAARVFLWTFLLSLFALPVVSFLIASHFQFDSYCYFTVQQNSFLMRAFKVCSHTSFAAYC